MLTIGPDDPDPIGRLEHEIGATRLAGSIPGDGKPPFVGGWVVALGYELGRSVEPSAAVHPTRTDPDWPWSIVLWRCPSAIAFDHGEGQWWAVGPAGDRPEALMPHGVEVAGELGRFELGEPEPTRSREEYVAAVRRAVGYIHAGDCFQVNLAHRIGAAFSGSARSLLARMLDGAGPWYGAYLELTKGNELHCALSMSPELLLRHDAPTGLVTTRPIKGTRPGHADPNDLRNSAKDQAELNMIIDLMRNDLGRVCRVGSVRVAEHRAIERHGSGWPGSPSRASAFLTNPSSPGPESRATRGVHHGVATIEGTMRDDRTIADLLRAVFPGGSITGAPKVRAMQIIEELEPTARGLYTGAIGYISDCGNASLNIAIRTAIVRGRRADPLGRLDEVAGATLTFGAGAGIVADSVPELEWLETLDKAGVLRNLSHDSPAVAIARRLAHGARPDHAPSR